MLHGFIPLTDHSIIAASGSDARHFLHAQLTSDIEHLPNDRAVLAGYCSAKGRLLALFTAFISEQTDVLLVGDASLMPQTLKRLQMFVLRAQCKLRNADTEYRIIGIANNNVRNYGFTDRDIGSIQRSEWGSLIRLQDADGVMRYWLVVSQEKFEAVMHQLAETLTPLTQTQWDALQVQAAVPRISAPVVEQFVPQMVNLEALGGVNFKKGCYPGQEVVARSQYRGTLKRRMFPVQALDAQTQIAAGQEVFLASEADQPVGMIVMGAGDTALSELKLSAVEAMQAGTDSLHLSSAQGARLDVKPLPYALPVEV